MYSEYISEPESVPALTPILTIGPYYTVQDFQGFCIMYQNQSEVRTVNASVQAYTPRHVRLQKVWGSNRSGVLYQNSEGFYMPTLALYMC